jgi:hypothetical protein
MTLFFIFGSLLFGAACFWYGRYTQKIKDENVYVQDEDEPLHAIKYPHHIHGHDQKQIDEVNRFNPKK